MPEMTVSIRQGEQSGQMLVAVIVLLALMFFIGTAMALAVSSSLHTIAQTNSMDARSYAAESAVAEGFASNRLRTAPAPTVGHVGGDGNTTWSYSYEVVGVGGLLGRSAVTTDKRGVDNTSAANHETITIAPNPTGAVSFELYRTGGGPSAGYLGTVVADSAKGFTVIDDIKGAGDQPLDAKPVPPMCTSPSLSSLSRGSNTYTLTATSCRVPVDSASTATHMWSGAEQVVQSGKCATQPIGFSPGEEPGTLWGVIGWHSLDRSSAAKLTVSVEDSCGPDQGNKCSVRTIVAPGQQYGVFHYWCHLSQDVETENLQILNQGGKADVSAFVVRAAASGTDCVVTVAGQVGPVANEADSHLTACNWDLFNQTLWNRVLS